MQLIFILQLDYADMLIHARLADRHNTHSAANAVHFRGIPPVQACSILPWFNQKGAPLGRSDHPEGGWNRNSARAGLPHDPMRHQIAVAKDITTSLPSVPTLFISQMAFFGITSLSL